MNDNIIIGNEGQAIKQTNYWHTKHAAAGLVFLSWNAGAARLLVPESASNLLAEMKGAQYVIISRGKYADRDALEILFEDGSDAPFCIHIMAEQSDRMLPENDQGGGFVVTVWSPDGQKYGYNGKYRVVEALPCLDPWSEQ